MNTGIDRPLIPGMRATPTVGQITRALRARWRIVAAAVVVFMVLAVIAALLMKSYEARASLVIEFPSLDPVTGQARSTALADSYRATQIDLMTSQNVMLGVVDQLGLAEDAEFSAEVDGDGGEGTLRQRLASKLGEQVQVRAGQVSQLLVLSYRGDDPQRSAAIVNAVIDQYMKASETMATDPARQRRQLGQVPQVILPKLLDLRLVGRVFELLDGGLVGGDGVMLEKNEILDHLGHVARCADGGDHDIVLRIWGLRRANDCRAGAFRRGLAYQRASASCAEIASRPSPSPTARLVIRPRCTLSPSARCASSRQACFQPLFAIASTKGMVALPKASVEVRATAPGMLATQ